MAGKRAQVEKERIYMENWKRDLIQYFEAGAKSAKKKSLGVELEHFIVDRQTKEVVTYAGDKGVRAILTELMAKYPDAVILPDDELFGFRVPEFNITLEPASQLEISIVPDSSIRDIGKIYRDFTAQLNSILDKYDYMLCAVGYQPASRVEDLTLIPKHRYDWMNEYFRTSGTGGMQMMRGTASTQVSIDYESEEDFRRKLQAAYYYGPVFKLLMDNVVTFQGEPVKTHLKRTDIWRRTDPARCGILPGVFAENYGFGDYADFIGKMPPIFLKHGKEAELTGDKTVAEIFLDRPMDETMVMHVLSMAFPDVRLKQYLEIRFADSAPLPFALAYCALLKGFLYSESGLAYAQEQIRGGKIREQDFVDAHVPKTVEFSSEYIDLEEVKRNKDGYILKPMDAYASKGVYAAGREYEQPAWETLCADLYGKGMICQQYCEQYMTPNIDFAWGDGEWHPYINMPGLYSYNGRFAGILMRMACEEKIIVAHENERTAPVFVVKGRK